MGPYIKITTEAMMPEVQQFPELYFKHLMMTILVETCSVRTYKNLKKVTWCAKLLK
jgi:hypothetical protein